MIPPLYESLSLKFWKPVNFQGGSIKSGIQINAPFDYFAF